MDISTCGQEHLDAIGSPPASCEVQRRDTTVACRIHINAGLNEQRHQLDTFTSSRKVKWSVPFRIGRFQICPRVAKELEAGRAVTAIITFAQAMKRRFGYIKSMLVIDCIWRLPGFKQAPELLDVTAACGFVYGCHGQAVRGAVYGGGSQRPLSSGAPLWRDADAPNAASRGS